MTNQIAHNIAIEFCKINPEFSIVPAAQKTNYAEVSHHDGAMIGFFHDAYRKKVSCSGRYPRGINGSLYSPANWGVIDYGEKGPSACVSNSRNPVKAAADFSRRVLKAYLELFEKCVKVKESQLSERDNSEQIANEILSVIGIKTKFDDIYSSKTEFYNPVRGSLHVGSTDVDIELKSITADQAKRILAIAAE